MSLKLTIHATGQGFCSLDRKKKKKRTAGAIVSFEDGTVTNRFLSYDSLADLLELKVPPDPELGEALASNGETRNA